MLLTLFLPALDGISPYMSITWQQPVGIGLTLIGMSSESKKIFHLQKSLEICDENSADKIQSKTAKGKI